MGHDVSTGSRRLPLAAAPAAFQLVFGNDIDGHQQTREGRDGNLNGYLYIQYTGVLTKDNYPVASLSTATSSAQTAMWAGKSRAYRRVRSWCVSR